MQNFNDVKCNVDRCFCRTKHHPSIMFPLSDPAKIQEGENEALTERLELLEEKYNVCYNNLHNMTLNVKSLQNSKITLTKQCKELYKIASEATAENESLGGELNVCVKSIERLQLGNRKKSETIEHQATQISKLKKEREKLAKGLEEIKTAIFVKTRTEKGKESRAQTSSEGVRKEIIRRESKKEVVEKNAGVSLVPSLNLNEAETRYRIAYLQSENKKHCLNKAVLETEIDKLRAMLKEEKTRNEGRRSGMRKILCFRK